MAFFAPICDDLAQGYAGGFLNNSFNRTKQVDRSVNVEINVTVDKSDNTVNNDNSVRNRGFLAGNTISLFGRLLRPLA